MLTCILAFDFYATAIQKSKETTCEVTAKHSWKPNQTAGSVQLSPNPESKSRQQLDPVMRNINKMKKTQNKSGSEKKNLNHHHHIHTNTHK